jgi:hypothetical protein
MSRGLPNLRLPEAPGIRNAPTPRQRPDDAETPPAQFHLPTTTNARTADSRFNLWVPINRFASSDRVFGTHTLEDMLTSIRAICDDALAGIEHFRRIADLYANGHGQYPDRFGLSALVARLLGEQHATTVRWGDWAEQLISRWDEPAGADVHWGIETIRATGEAFPVEG